MPDRGMLTGEDRQKGREMKEEERENIGEVKRRRYQLVPKKEEDISPPPPQFSYLPQFLHCPGIIKKKLQL